MAIIAYRAGHIDFGIDTTRLLTMSLALPEDTYPTADKQTQFYDQLLSQLRSDQAVEGAMISSNLGETRFALDDREYHDTDDYPIATAITLSDSPQPLGTRI